MEKELFSVNEGYKIGLSFFLLLWPFLEPKVKALNINKKGNIPIVYQLFFYEVCSGFESSPEWFEAVFRVKHVPQAEQKQIELTEAELFSCDLEFCKLHNERWENILDYTVRLLESMQQHPEQHSLEWGIWKKAKQHLADYPNSFYNVDWSAEPLNS